MKKKTKSNIINMLAYVGTGLAIITIILILLKIMGLL